MAVSDGILDTTKLQLQLDPEDDSYDAEIVIHINSIFFILTQLGVGPVSGFSILGRDEKWSEFIEKDQINAVRSYMGLKVKLLFDPPATGPATEAMERQAEQMEWRLNMHMEEVKWDAAQQTSSLNTGLF
jgi:hypothetical protein